MFCRVVPERLRRVVGRDDDVVERDARAQTRAMLPDLLCQFSRVSSELAPAFVEQLWGEGLMDDLQDDNLGTKAVCQ